MYVPRILSLLPLSDSSFLSCEVAPVALWESLHREWRTGRLTCGNISAGNWAGDELFVFIFPLVKDRHQSGDVQLHVVISLANVGNTGTVVVRPDVSATQQIVLERWLDRKFTTFMLPTHPISILYARSLWPSGTLLCTMSWNFNISATKSVCCCTFLASAMRKTSLMLCEFLTAFLHFSLRRERLGL